MLGPWSSPVLRSQSFVQAQDRDISASCQPYKCHLSRLMAAHCAIAHPRAFPQQQHAVIALRPGCCLPFWFGLKFCQQASTQRSSRKFWHRCHVTCLASEHVDIRDKHGPLQGVPPMSSHKILLCQTPPLMPGFTHCSVAFSHCCIIVRCRLSVIIGFFPVKEQAACTVSATMSASHMCYGGSDTCGFVS